MNSVKKLIRALKGRFGGANQADKYRIEVKSRRRKAGESLQNLHSDIRRLVALAFPNLDHKARELMACDYFIDALDDPNFALKVRERMPKNLDSALRIALQLEVWTKDVDRVRQDLQKDRRNREVAKAEPKKQDLTEALSKRITELEKQLAEVRNSKSNPSSAEGASSSVEREKRNGECWGCGDPNHRLWGCPKLSTEEKKRLDRRKIRPIMDHSAGTCITVRHKGRSIAALVDTGSDITIVGVNVARKHRWKVRPCELKSVKAANGEPMLIDGHTEVCLSVGRKLIRSNIYVSPDITDLILGIDWLRKQGKFVWDFDREQIQFGNGEWIALRQESEPGCHRIYVETDVVLPPRQESVAPIRISRTSRTDQPFEGVTESRTIPNLSHVYSSRSVLPAVFTGLHTRVVNASDRTQVLKKGTNLGKLEKADIIQPKSENPNQNKSTDNSDKAVDVVQLMVDSLPNELTEPQRKKVRQLLLENEAIFSKGEYDIGRTSLVEYRIDTGTHRPIRQPLRRHPFKYLEVIDEQVEEMTKHGIVEPAASPWASNVVLVRKKDNSLRFCIGRRQLNRITTQDN